MGIPTGIRMTKQRREYLCFKRMELAVEEFSCVCKCAVSEEQNRLYLAGFPGQSSDQCVQGIWCVPR